MIRPAVHSDIPEMMVLSKRFYDEMDFDEFGYAFDYDHIKTNYAASVSNPEKFILLVSEKAGVIDGIAWWVISDTTQYFKGLKFAQEIVWHSDPLLATFQRSKIMINLLNAISIKLKELGIISFYLSTDVRPGFEGVGRYLESRGYKEMCRYWHKGV